MSSTTPVGVGAGANVGSAGGVGTGLGGPGSRPTSTLVELLVADARAAGSKGLWPSSRSRARSNVALRLVISILVYGGLVGCALQTVSNGFEAPSMGTLALVALVIGLVPAYWVEGILLERGTDSRSSIWPPFTCLSVGAIVASQWAGDDWVLLDRALGIFVLPAVTLGSFYRAYRSRWLRLREVEIHRRTALWAGRARELGVDVLRVGQKAPEIVSSKIVKTSRPSAGEKLWVIFYRYADCPICLDHLDWLKTQARAVRDAGIKVIAVFESRETRLARPRRMISNPNSNEGSWIELIADPQREFYRAYGAQRSWRGFFKGEVFLALLRASLRGYWQGPITGNLAQMPAHFLIDEGGKIIDAYYGSHAADQISLDRVLKTWGTPA